MVNILFRNNIIKKAKNFNVSSFFKLEEVANNYNNDLDTNIHETLVRLNNLEINSITIPISITENFFEFSGLRLGHHIRLTEKLTFNECPIVFFGSLEEKQLLKLSSLSSILLTPNVFYVNLSNHAFGTIEKSIKNLDQKKDGLLFDYNKYINKVNFNAPANYESHHSIANEWALARYFSMFKKDDNNEVYISLSRKILELNYLKTLHFKFIEAKHTRQKFNPKKHVYSPVIKGINQLKIGVIDDEIYKGWNYFYEYLFSKSKAETITYKDFKKHETKNELLQAIKDNWINNNIESTNPIDLYIIDLRLHDDDFSEKDFDKLSGVQIIKYLKTINPGIQIIVFSASNKVWNFQKCLKFGVNQYFIKESPETFNSRADTKKDIDHLTKGIELASNKIFLAACYREINSLKTENIFTSNSENKEFKELVFSKNGLLDQIINLLIIDSSNDAILNQCLLIVFKILERYCDLPLVGDFSKSKAKSTGFIWQKDGAQKDIYISDKEKKEEHSLFNISYGQYKFQTDSNKSFPKTIEVYDSMKLKINKSKGTETTTLIKIISVLRFREEISITALERILLLRFYRSNVAAHLTGAIKPEYKITHIDIIFFISLFSEIFSKIQSDNNI
jgi:CheY-like chemotaxis protein